MNALFAIGLGIAILAIVLAFMIGYEIGKQAKARKIHQSIVNETKKFTSDQLREMYYRGEWPKSNKSEEKP